MEIQAIKTNNFKGFNAPVKTLFLQGAFGDKVTRGFYGEHLTLKNVSLEHLNPRSLGGKDGWANLVLTACWANRKRGIKPLRAVIEPEKAIAYLEQFAGIHIPGQFDGNAYIRMVKRNLQGMKIFLDSMNIERRVKAKPFTTSPKGRYR